MGEGGTMNEQNEIQAIKAEIRTIRVYFAIAVVVWCGSGLFNKILDFVGL